MAGAQVMIAVINRSIQFLLVVLRWTGAFDFGIVPSIWMTSRRKCLRLFFGALSFFFCRLARLFCASCPK